ncbi:MAG: chitobiase/beta-hexosaminidase C-terminal domain-containing protein, partial [Bacteroidota bacterium]|nr:chitobiase/beta-hexosaminidase C-terminal domain-containing protein [Bacteroidota bacterium]
MIRLSTYCLNRLLAIAILLISPVIHASMSQKIIISEFLALNSTGLKDEDGDYSDWIELYNPGETAVDLTGWHLTDNSDEPGKWTFPVVSIGAGDYLVIFASGKDRAVPAGQLHTNFKLSGGGEYLALIEADSGVISYEYAPAFPPQQTNVSYGIYLNQQTFFSTPTPGAGNRLGTTVMDPVFSACRGFYDKPFTVSLSVSDPSAVIYYTTDGTIPSAATGKCYTASIQISTTTPLSAVCISNGIASHVVTHTYIFPEAVVRQSATPAGYPSGWGTLQYGLTSTYTAGTRAPADYEMDPDICNSSIYKSLIDKALKAIPTVSIVTNPGYLFSYSANPDTGGIYIYTGDVAYDNNNPKATGSNTLGATWERPASVEWYDPSDSSGFQIDCGLRLHGGNSRKSYNSPKHSFTLSFRSQYGFSKLNYDLFDDKKAVERFDDLVLRAGYNFSWLKIQGGYTTCAPAQYLNDPFARQTLLDMGAPASHGKFVHLYINGLYWGLYELSEKINKKFAEAYLGGENADYDVLNDDIDTSKPALGLVDGNTAAWNSLKALSANSDPYNELMTNHLLDMTNFVDYMLMNFYIGNTDWDKNNWFMLRNRIEPGNGFDFTSWDAETSLTDVSLDKVNQVSGFPTTLFSQLKKNKEFKLLVADRIQRHFFNEGALTAEEAARRYEKLASNIDTAIIGESARWGDYCKDVSLADVTTKVPYNLYDHWLPRKNDLMTNYFPKRSQLVFNQLKTAGFVPSTEAPQYNSQGGKLSGPIELTISATTGSIYYTIDGTDPRTPVTSAVSNNAYLYGKPLRVIGAGTVNARAKNGSEWSALSQITFLSEDTVHFIDNGSGIPVIGGNRICDVFCVNSTIHFTLPAEGFTKLDIFGTDGHLVATLANGNLPAGHHQ